MFSFGFKILIKVDVIDHQHACQRVKRGQLYLNLYKLGGSITFRSLSMGSMTVVEYHDTFEQLAR